MVIPTATSSKSTPTNQRDSRDKTRSVPSVHRTAQSQLPRNCVSPVSSRTQPTKRTSSIVMGKTTARSSGAVTKPTGSTQPVSSTQPKPMSTGEKCLKVLMGMHKTMRSMDSRLSYLTKQSNESSSGLRHLQAQVGCVESVVEAYTPKIEAVAVELKRLGKSFCLTGIRFRF